MTDYQVAAIQWFALGFDAAILIRIVLNVIMRKAPR